VLHSFGAVSFFQPNCYELQRANIGCLPCASEELNYKVADNGWY